MKSIIYFVFSASVLLISDAALSASVPAIDGISCATPQKSVKSNSTAKSKASKNTAGKKKAAAKKSTQIKKQTAPKYQERQIGAVSANEEPEQEMITDVMIVNDAAAMTDDEKVFVTVEEMPSFPGGQTELMRWLAAHIIYPKAAVENNISGRVIVTFNVEKDGSITDVKVARGVDKDLDKEAIRVVRKMPKWNPGKNNGVIVRSKYTLPVTFKLQN
ncbi:MAG: energy transducer TonB [Muribaculaceae bacterium]|nr:energy transducer TonB [Muribaculaceae bacterium]